jgi:hypothetical protein
MSKSTASIGIGDAPALIAVAGIGDAGASSCAYEFHALQSGQRPSHFEAWAPHSVQEKTIVFFATDRDCSNRVPPFHDT